MNNKEAKIVESNGSAAIIIDENYQLDRHGKVENIRAPDRVILVAGANTINNDDSDKLFSEFKASLSAAGIFITQAASTSYVLNPDRNPNGIVLPQPVKNQATTETEKGLSNVTIFADDHRYVAFGKGGINMHTGLVRDKKSLNTGAGVSLIHGKSADTLEPMVKGKSLRKTIHNLETVISNINNNQFDLAFRMIALTKIFAGHFHFVPQVPAGVLPSAPSIAAIVHGVLVTPSEIKGQVDNVITELNSILNAWNQSPAVEGNYLSDHHKLN